MKIYSNIDNNYNIFLKNKNQEPSRSSTSLTSDITFKGNPSKLRQVGRKFNERLYVLGLKVPLLKQYWKLSEDAAKSFGINDYRETKAYRHVWSNAHITYKYGKLPAKILGNLNEYRNPFCVVRDANGDMWNNKVGRELGARMKKERIPIEQLGILSKQTLEEGKLIIHPDKDPRKYQSRTFTLFEKFANFLQKG